LDAQNCYSILAAHFWFGIARQDQQLLSFSEKSSSMRILATVVAPLSGSAAVRILAGTGHQVHIDKLT